MSSVAVLTQESFAEHRSGLVPQQIKGDGPFCAFLLHSETSLLRHLCQIFLPVFLDTETLKLWTAFWKASDCGHWELMGFFFRIAVSQLC